MSLVFAKLKRCLNGWAAAYLHAAARSCAPTPSHEVPPFLGNGLRRQLTRQLLLFLSCVEEAANVFPFVVSKCGKSPLR